MKRIFILLLMIIGISPFIVKACSLAAPQSGFEIQISGCEYDDDKEYLFDVLFEKDSIDPDLYNSSINLEQINEIWGDQIPETLDQELPYQNIDNEFISLLGYGYELDYSYHNGCYQMILRDQIDEQGDENPYQYEDFKIVVLDMDYNVIYTSEVFSKTELPGFGSTYSRFIYSPETNTVTTEEHDMYYPSIDDCGMFYSNTGLWMFLTFGFLGVIILVSLSESVILAYKKAKPASAILSFVTGIAVLFLSLSFGAYRIREALFATTVVIAIVLARYLAIRQIERGYDIDFRIRKVIFIYTIIFMTMPATVYIFYYLLTNN